MSPPQKPGYEPHEIEWDFLKTVRLWDYYSRSSAHQSKYFGRQAGAEVARLLKRMVLSRASTILDFSCGKGDLISALVKHLSGNQTIYGADTSSASVQQAINKNQHFRAFGGATVIDGYPLTFDASSFDLILVTEVIEHLSDAELDAALDETLRLLKPKGLVFITTPFEENLEASKALCPECGCIFHQWQHLRSWKLGELEETMLKKGFKTVTCRNIQWGPTLLKLYFKLVGRKGNGIYYIGAKGVGSR